MSRSLLLLLALSMFAVAACEDRKAPSGEPAPGATDTTAVSQKPVPAQPDPGAITGPRTPLDFGDTVYTEYAYVATSIPKRVTDSLIGVYRTDPKKLEVAMTAYLRRQDTITRKTLAAKHGISLDSLNAILAAKERAADTAR